MEKLKPHYDLATIKATFGTSDVTMAKKARTQPCPSCGEVMRFERHDDVLAYRGQEKHLKILGWWCRSCGEAILDGAALAEREKAFLELKADVDEVLGPAEVAAVRTKLGLSQRRAGELLGGGPRAFQKYEAGKQAVSVPMSHLLRLLANDPKRLQEIDVAVASVERPSRRAGRPARVVAPKRRDQAGVG